MVSYSMCLIVSSCYTWLAVAKEAPIVVHCVAQVYRLIENHSLALIHTLELLEVIATLQG